MNWLMVPIIGLHLLQAGAQSTNPLQVQKPKEQAH